MQMEVSKHFKNPLRELSSWPFGYSQFFLWTPLTQYVSMWLKQWLEFRRSTIMMWNWLSLKKFGLSLRPSSATLWSSPMQPGSFTCLSKWQILRIIPLKEPHAIIIEMESTRKMTSCKLLNPWRALWTMDAVARLKVEFQI